MSNELSEPELLAELRAVLKRRGVSLRTISAELGVPYRSVQNYISGESKLPAVFFLRVCELAGVESDYFIQGHFRPSGPELWDAIAHALDLAGLLPPGNGERESMERSNLVSTVTAHVSERYDRKRSERITLKGAPYGRDRRGFASPPRPRGDGAQ